MILPKNGTHIQTYGTLRAAKAILPKNKQASTNFTCQKLKKLPNQNEEWQQSKFKQLDQYHSQEMFRQPYPLPQGANILNLSWAYLVKTDSTKKICRVCNGQPKFKGTVVFGYTFAKMSDM